MFNTIEIQSYSLKDILNALEQEEQAEELHISYDQKPIEKNPFPYPFRSENIGIMIVQEGKVKIKINLETYLVEKDQLICIPPRAVIQVVEVVEAIKSIGVIFTENFAQKMVQNYNEVNVLRFFSLKEFPVWLPSDQKMRTIVGLVECLYSLNSDVETYYREQRIYHYFNALTLELISFYKENAEKIEMKTSRKKELILDFLDLLSVHAKNERSVQFYADKLFVTSAYLSRVLKEASGFSTREIIEEAVVMEARDLLMGTSFSLAQIAEKLNFSDQSFFGKFFKKKMKMSPKTFRKQYK